jgi:hypothetical protein
MLTVSAVRCGGKDLVQRGGVPESWRQTTAGEVGRGEFL